MDLRVIIMALVIIYEVEMVPVLRSQPRHRRAVKTSKCDMEWYFDRNLGENGRCQPCGEICDPIWRTEEQCLANIDQCRGTYDKYHPTTTSTVVQTTLTTVSEIEPRSQTILIVAVATGLVALVTSVLLAVYLYKKHRKAIKNRCRSCVNRPNLIKPVVETSPHVSREQICVSGVNNPISSTGQALLCKFSQEESVPLSHNPEFLQEQSYSLSHNPESAV